MRAVDVHVHPTDERIARAWGGEIEDAERFFRGSWTHEDLDATAERYRKLDVFAVLLGADAETTTGVPAYPNDELAAACRKYPDRFIAFAGVDPWKGVQAIHELERCVHELVQWQAVLHRAADDAALDRRVDPHVHPPTLRIRRSADSPLLVHGQDSHRGPPAEEGFCASWGPVVASAIG